MLLRLTLFVALGATSLAQAQNAAPQNANWTRPFPPFRMIGNIFWVGSYDLSTYLITTPQGNILINTGVGTPRSRSRQAWSSWVSSSPTPKS
jgi:metallo-beta-lactamase class B